MPAGLAAGAECALDEEDAAHLRVLRLGAGAPVRAVDGAGHCFAARVTRVEKRGAHVLLDADTTPAGAPHSCRVWASGSLRCASPPTCRKQRNWLTWKRL